DAVNRVPRRIASNALDVETFVHLPAVRTHAAKPAGGPRFSDCADEELLFTAGLQQRVIGGWEMEGLRQEGTPVKRQQSNRQRTTEDSLHVKARSSFCTF